VNYAKLLEMDSFLLGISFYKLAKHKICQVNFGKLLELLLPLLFFLAKAEKIFSNRFPSQVVIYPKLGKTDSARAYMRATILGASTRIRRGGRV
jgi:hypothetical protein